MYMANHLTSCRGSHTKQENMSIHYFNQIPAFIFQGMSSDLVFCKGVKKLTSLFLFGQTSLCVQLFVLFRVYILIQTCLEKSEHLRNNKLSIVYMKAALSKHQQKSYMRFICPFLTSDLENALIKLEKSNYIFEITHHCSHSS